MTPTSTSINSYGPCIYADLTLKQCSVIPSGVAFRRQRFECTVADGAVAISQDRGSGDGSRHSRKWNPFRLTSPVNSLLPVTPVPASWVRS